MSEPSYHSSRCPFCEIAASHPPRSLSDCGPTPQSKDDMSTQTHILLSTKHVLAFLDIMPLTQGHVLVIPRRHFRNLGEVKINEGKELGKWLPVLSRVIVRTILGSEPDERGQDPAHWNVVQNNGLRAAQTVPHAHFHIIPRPPLEKLTAAKTSWVMFGRGQREELDEDEGASLAAKLRSELAKEIVKIKEIEGIDLNEVDSDDTHKFPRMAKL